MIDSGARPADTGVPISGGSENRCSTCHRSLSGRYSYAMRAKHGFQIKCTRCSLLDRALFLRSAMVASVVGTVLFALNQGDQLISGTYPWSTSWYKIPLTYVVPFCVATYGALSNGYRGSDR